jgi:hypothetical protein
MWFMAAELAVFQVTELLGTGHEASVYRVSQPDGARDTALKIQRRMDGPDAQFENERATLLALQELATRDGGMAVQTAAGERSFNPSEHMPMVVEDDAHLHVVLHFDRVGDKLTCANIRGFHPVQLFWFLRWLHRDAGRFHRDLSYNNLLVDEVDGSLLLIDWEFSMDQSEAEHDDAFKGTPLSMSQRQLGAVAEFLNSEIKKLKPLARRQEQLIPFTYMVQDELEAAVKSILLILSPSLKRRLKQQAVKNCAEQNRIGPAWQGSENIRDRLRVKLGMYEHVHGVWERVLPAQVLLWCEGKDYEALGDWLSTQLLHFDPSEQVEPVE